MHANMKSTLRLRVKTTVIIIAELEHTLIFSHDFYNFNNSHCLLMC